MPPLVLTLMTELPPTVWTPSVTTIGEICAHRCCRRAANQKHRDGDLPAREHQHDVVACSANPTRKTYLSNITGPKRRVLRRTSSTRTKAGRPV